MEKKQLAQALRKMSGKQPDTQGITIHIDMGPLMAKMMREIPKPIENKQDEFQKVEGLTPHVS